MAGQVRVLGALWIVWSFLHLIPAFGAFLLGPFIARSAAWPEFHHFGWPEHFMIALFGGILGLVSILGLVAGWALLTYQSWARIFLIVMACLALFNFPIGTALGVYTLWVLLPSESAEEYRRMTTA